MIIYKKDNTIRAALHQSDDSDVKWDISGEEYATIRITTLAYISFETGDYVELYGQRFTLYSIATPVEKRSSEHFVYTLRFDSLRRDLQNVNFVLFDNTTSGTEPEYVASTTYSIGDKAKYNNVVYQYINTAPSAGKTPAEGEWWTVVRTAPIWDFPIVLDPKRFAQMIVDNMNRARPNETWTVGYCIDHSPLQCTFSNTDCLEAATSIASAFETEFWVGNYTINFGKRADTTSLTMQYGAEGGFKGITRTEISNTKKVTRLVALGSERNLKGTYRNGSPRLMLPNAYYLDSANIDVNNPLEEVVTWDSIYPCLEHAKTEYSPTTSYSLGDQVLYNRISWDYIYATPSAGNVPATASSYWRMSEGSVTSMVSTLKFTDANLTFNPLDAAYAMSDGTQAKVAFLTGNLAGYELPIQSYDPLTKSITLGTIEDGTDNIIPAKDYTFAYGDQYFFVDIYMPQTYIDKAEQRLLAKANEYLAKYSYDTVAYKGDVSIIWATENAIELHIGDMITVVDTDYGVNDEFRIISLTRNITNPYKYTIELSQLPYIPSRIEDIENAVNDNNDYIDRNGSDKIMFRAHTYKGAKEALDMAFDPEGNYFTDKIKPLIVETSQVLVGTNTQQYQLTGLEFSTLSSNPNHVDWTAGTITDSSMEESARAWNIAAGSFDADVDPLKSYYCYIVCTRATGSLVAEIQFSEDKKTVKFDNTYYYFLLGTLGQKIDGVRQFWTSKGFTFISGDTIVTGRIKNTTGTVDINLTEGKMVIGSGTQKLEFNVDNDGKLKITGTIEAVAGLIAGWAIGTDTISKGNVVLGANGSISCVVGGVTYWTLNPDGSGSVGKGGITWNAAGEVSGSFTTFESDGDLNVDGNIYATGGIVAKSLLPTLPTEWPQAGTGVEGVVKYDGTTLDRNANGQLYVKTSGGTVVSWGTEVAGQSVQLIVAAVTKTLALASHTHTGYQPADADLTAIAALAGTSGLLKKTAADTWTLDTSTYLTAITKAMVEAVLTGNITSHTHSQYLLSSAYTAADVLSKLLTVDGDGSGLDADTLDTYHETSFPRIISTSNNLNTITRTGMYSILDGAYNIPSGATALASHLVHYNWDANAAVQMYYNWADDRVWTRRKIGSSTWNGWILLWNASNSNLKTVNWSAKDLSAVNGYFDGAVVAKYLSSTFATDWPVMTASVLGVAKASGLAVYPTAGDLALRVKHYTTTTTNSWQNKAYSISMDIPITSPASLAANSYHSSTFLYALPTSKCLACVVSAIPYATGTTPPWIGHQLIVSATKDSTGYWRIFIYNPTSSAVDLTNVRLSIIAQMIE